METVAQPSAVRPTNKLTAATIAALVVSLLQVSVRNLQPEWYDEAVFTALMPVTVGLLGFLVKDRPNT